MQDFPYSKIVFSRRKSFKKGLNNSKSQLFMKNTDFQQEEKQQKTQGNFGFFRSRKITPTFLPKIFPSKIHSKGTKNSSKSLPKTVQYPPKNPILSSNTTCPFYRRRFQKYFQTRKIMDKVWYLLIMAKKRLFSLVKGNAPQLKHTIKKIRKFSWCSSLERLPTRLWLAFPLNFAIFDKDFKPKSGCFERK